MTIRSKRRLNFSNSEPFNIVLVEPEIPPNTGNIARLCAATSSKLHLIHPLGFQITDKELKRAGLDYWPLLEVKEYLNWNEFCEIHENNCIEPARRRDDETANQQFAPSPHCRPCAFWFISTRGKKNIWDVEFNPGDFLIFGSETKGLSEDILNQNKEQVISIPMNGLTRSLNLSTSVGIVLYEALRQCKERELVEIAPI